MALKMLLLMLSLYVLLTVSVIVMALQNIEKPKNKIVGMAGILTHRGLSVLV